MRKCVFLFGAVAAAVCVPGVPAETERAALFRGIELYTGASAKLKESAEDSSWLLGAGLKAMFRDADFRIYGTVSEPETVRFGGLVSLKGFSGVPLDVRGGNLVISGSLSKMNSPALYAAALPFAGGVGAVTGISVSLPSASGAKKPYCAAAVYQQRGKRVLNALDAAFFYDETERFAASARAVFKAGKTARISASLTAGSFLLESESSGTWFSDTRIFPETRLLCGRAAAAFVSPLLKSSAAVNVYESAFGGANFTFSTENTVRIGQLTLNAAAFAASSREIVTASSKKLGTTAQLKVNPQYAFFPTASLKVRLGAAFLAERKTETDDGCASCKTSLGAELRTLRSVSRAVFSASGFVLSPDGAEDLDSARYSAKLTGSLLTAFRPTAATTFSFTPPHGSTEFSSETKWRFSMRMPGRADGTASAGFTLTGGRAAAEKGSLSVSTGWKFRCGKIRCSASAALQYDFAF